jgi:hypothetical protein
MPNVTMPLKPTTHQNVSSGRWVRFPSLLLLVITSLVATPPSLFAIGEEQLVRFDSSPGTFPIVAAGSLTPMTASTSDYPGILRVLRLFRGDIKAVTGKEPPLFVDRIPPAKEVIIVGTIGRNELINQLMSEQKLDPKGVSGQWESFLIQTVEHPFPGVDRALVIAGSDKRGTIYGLFTLSEQIGVSPWYWWADVPVKHHTALFVLPGKHTDGPPSVKYRGIFLNDEYPDLTNWVAAKYGFVPVGNNPPIPAGVANYGREFYQRLFELLLRLKANYLWPAMWNNAFNEDDPENARLADEYGIVMGTSHQEPMLRAQKEWDRRYLATLGTWNYAKYPDTLQDFWRKGIRRNRDYESIITIGLRGANDTPMAPGGPEANKDLLERIIGVQRTILAQEMNTDVTKVPQLWCLYKEVLDFYKAGMRVPDDVTLLWPDDNWGNVRRLPTAEERRRSGGAGVYYHFDYHGGPRSYQWINTNPIAKIWDQMSLAKEYGADRIWIVNVGHFKGYEFPLEYFLSLAWNTHRWTNDNIGEFTRLWAAREFGPECAPQIADIIAQYTRFNGRRKPELLSPATYSLVNYREAETVVADFDTIAHRAEEISSRLPAEDRDAFYELVLFPTKASAMVNALYYAAGKNALYARQGRAATNDMDRETRALFAQDTSLMGYFNRSFANGKWDHFMDQPHLGYTSWQDPPTNSLKAIPLVDLTVPDTAVMGVAIEGSEAAWPESRSPAVLPPFDPFGEQRHALEIFNKGSVAFPYTVTSSKPWIQISAPEGSVEKQTRVWITIDWKKVPRGNGDGIVTIDGTGRQVEVGVRLSKARLLARDALRGFLEEDGCVSMEAAHFTRRTGSGKYRWIPIEEYGHTLSGMRASAPVSASPAVPGKDAPCLEYRMYLLTGGHVDVEGIFGPTLNFVPGRGLRYAVSFDNEPPKMQTLVPEAFSAQNGNSRWEELVENNAHHSHSAHFLGRPGYHTLKIWMVDPGVVIEKLVVNLGGVRPSSLGPPESFSQGVKRN